VQSREDQHVINPRLLKIDDAVPLYETAVAKQHGSGDGALIRAGCEKFVQRNEKAATNAGKAVEQRQSGMSQNRKQLPVAQCALQLNILACEIAAKVKAPGIAKIVDRAYAGKYFDAISGACRRRSFAR
jgi:hypothetical protein